MPIHLFGYPSTVEESLFLNNIEFINEAESQFFRISDLEGHEIRVEYIPNYVSHWDHEQYEIFLFENPYLNAENDVFELKEKTVSKRFGWIFPISTLESNDNDYVDFKSFKHIRWVAYNKLLRLSIKLDYNDSNQDYRLTDFYSNTCVCILSKEEIRLVSGFRIENYILSFLKYDYLLYQTENKGVAVFDKKIEIKQLRAENHVIHLKRSNFNIVRNFYTKSLFLEHLYQSKDFLVRYIFLYQILEHLIQEQADRILMGAINSYQNKTISKNDLREQMSKFQSDKNLLIEVFKQSSIQPELRAKYLENCKFLYSDINRECKDTFEEVVYAFRNLITHDYRILVQKTKEVKELIYLFELIIIELLINYKIEQNTKELLPNPATELNGDDEMGYHGLSSWCSPQT